MGEVRDVRVETRSREVDLSWTPPRRRGRGPGGPQARHSADRSRTTATAIEALLDQAHDRGLEPDRVYHYGIFAVYRMPDGRSTASRGVFVAARRTRRSSRSRPPR